VATTKTSPKAGDTFVLTAPEGHGTGIGALPKGTEVAVSLVHKEQVPGVGGTEGVLFTWTPDSTEYSRSAHLPLADFTRLFTKAGK